MRNVQPPHSPHLRSSCLRYPACRWVVAMSYPYDRPSSEPGGMECMECGKIFVGSAAHDICGVCANNGWLPISTASRDPTMVLLAFKDDNDLWVCVGGWYEAGMADQCWYDIYHGPVEPKLWKPLKLPVQP